MELWPIDIVGGFALADGTSAKALPGVEVRTRQTGGRVCSEATQSRRGAHLIRWPSVGNEKKSSQLLVPTPLQRLMIADVNSVFDSGQKPRHGEHYDVGSMARLERQASQ